MCFLGEGMVQDNKFTAIKKTKKSKNIIPTTTLRFMQQALEAAFFYEIDRHDGSEFGSK